MSNTSRNNEIPSRAADGDASPRVGRALLRWAPALLLLWIIITSVVFVDETEYVIVEALGRIAAVYDQTDPVSGDRGLHLKLPWPIGTVRRFDRRQQLF